MKRCRICMRLQECFLTEFEDGYRGYICIDCLNDECDLNNCLHGKNARVSWFIELAKGHENNGGEIPLKVLQEIQKRVAENGEFLGPSET